MRTVAVILAGGTGRRIGAATPKQLLDVGGRPILGYSVATFAAHPAIDDVRVVMARGHTTVAREIADRYGAGRVSRVIEGGATRSESTLAALRDLAGEPDDTRVLLHDAARPFVTAGIVDRCLAALESFEAVAVGLPTTDTVVAVEDGLVKAMPPRDTLSRFQTPQGFRIGTLRKAYELAAADPGFAATDDCGVVHRYLPDVPIRVVEGDERNLKVTHPLDIVIAEHLAGRAADGEAP
ncbi:2-C-methyl-D-erythritol 4-phosphate cytidylyltransferase [Thermomonospora amylolytica]|uniref:2-C-methyl-D-erythritol 4-phosphate cytidylyltransferase n=1 Tax=Thermomonospora amylolytica TaxID=1411117 RepID=UPI000E6BF534|nr:2-C-methyl-D-erythritol 4-phosphate cytidylyltransferase [Thermomonospora amylolytica]